MAADCSPNFGDLLRQFRLAKGLTQEELGERAGLSARGISDIERRSRLHPRKETFELLAAALDLSEDDRVQLDVAWRGSLPPRPSWVSSAARLAPAESLNQPPRSALGSARAASFLHPFICPVLIGRERETERLGAVLKAVAAGGHGVVFLVGEPGIGKSRLLAEMLVTAEAAAFAHVRLACHELEQDEPYALARQLAEETGGAPEHLLRGLSDASRSARRAGHVLAGALTQFRTGRPLLVSVEDVHWADQSSLDVLLSVVEHLERVALVATLRPEPLSRGLAFFLAEANRLRLSTEITLRPLARGEAARVIYLTLNLAEPVPGPLLDEVMAATEGNPFLIEEVLRSLLESDGIECIGVSWRHGPGAALDLPRSLRHAVEARLLAASPTAARVAALAAVLGQKVDVPLLTSLSGLDEGSVLAALRELRDAQVLTSGDGSSGQAGLAFRHALTREAVLNRLMAPERQVLHRQVAQLLETTSGASAALLAYHWSQAGDRRRAGPYALRAARGAAELHAHREAIRHYELALAAEPIPNPEILIALGDHHAALGERDLAVGRYEEVREMWQSLADATRQAELALRIGMCEARERRRNAAIGPLRVAWSALPTGHADRWRAGLWLGLQHGAQGDYARALAILEEARGEAGGAGPIARLRIAYEIGGIRAATGDWAALERIGTQVLREAAGDSGDALALRLDVHHALGSIACYRGAFHRAWEHFRASRVLADQWGQPVDRAIADWNVAANVLSSLGRWTQARAALVELAATAPQWLATLARWYGLWLEGRWEDAAAQALQSWPQYDRESDVEIQIGVASRLLDIQLALGRAREALTLAQEVLSRGTTREAAGYTVRLLPYQAEAMVCLREPEAPAAIARGLDLTRRLGAPREEAMLLRARACAARDLGDWPAAFADCETAGAIARELGLPYDEARMSRQEALLRLRRGRRGDRDRAASALHAARGLFDQVGAHRDVADVDRILSGAGLAHRDARPAPPGLSRLSAREREVAAAIAEGLTNPAIAARLFLSERTVAHHVSAILTKLDLDTRSQVATYVARAAVSPNARNGAG